MMELSYGECVWKNKYVPAFVLKKENNKKFDIYFSDIMKRFKVNYSAR